MSVDLNSIAVWFGGDEKLTSREWLASERERLEDAIAPCMCSEPTAFSLNFRGEKRFVDSSRSVALQGCARKISPVIVAHALAYLDGIDAAIKAGDTDKLINRVYGFAICRHEIEDVEIWGMRATDALAATLRNKAIQSKRRKGSTLLTTAEQSKVVAFIEKQTKAGFSKKKASEMAAVQLRTGTLSGVRRKIPVEAQTIRKLLY